MSRARGGTRNSGPAPVVALRRWAFVLLVLSSGAALSPPALAQGQSCGLFDPCPSGQQCVVFFGECRHNPGRAGEICGVLDPCASDLTCVGTRCEARRAAGQSCTGIGQGSCRRGLLCDVTGVCRNDPPRVGQPCGLGVPCANGLSCTAVVGGVCAAPRAAGERCQGLGQGNCGTGLLCDVSGVCRNDPPLVGQPCGTGVPCAAGLSCNAFVGGVCTEALVSGDRCIGLGQGNCGEGLLCDVAGECRHPIPELGEPCGLGVACATGLACDAALNVGGRCVVAAAAGAACRGIGRGSCRSGLVCDVAGVCRHSPPERGEPCGVGVACATGLACDALVDGRCGEPARFGERCFGLGQGNCQEGASCRLSREAGGGLGQRCFPPSNDPLDIAACRRAYSPALSRDAAAANATLTFGLAAGGNAAVGGSTESGVAYGSNGEFGCFVTGCLGVVTDASIGTSVCVGVYDRFDSVAGDSSAVVEAVSTPGVELEFATAQIFESFSLPGARLIGSSNCLGIGIGVLPADAGVYNCATEVVVTDPDSNGDGMIDADIAVLNLDPSAAGGDTDRDGVPDVAEIGGDLERPMDIDGDGVIDALESGLAAADAAVAENVPLGGGRSVTVRTAGGELLSAVGGSPGDGTAPAGVIVTHGLVGYRSTAPVGGSVTVTLSFHDELPAGLSLFTVNYAGEVAVLTASAWSRVDASTVTVTSTDGDGATDLDGASDGFVDLLIGVGTTRSDDGNAGGSGEAAGGGSVTDGGAGNLVDDVGVEDGGGGGCSVGRIRQRDPLLPVLGLGALAWARVRRRDGLRRVR